MSEAKIIAQTRLPVTVEQMKREFAVLGVKKGMSLLVHSSLRSLGWVCGGAQAVIQALRELLTEEGTLVMPTHSAGLSDPAEWQNPPVPKEWVDIIRNEMPAFDPVTTGTRSMGQIAEQFRSWPGVVRSGHPLFSFAAWGKHAATVTENHGLDYGLGDDSPLARLYDLDASVLLLGVGFDTCTCFHLSEYRLEKRQEIRNAAPVFVDGQRQWTSMKEIVLRESDEVFVPIGEAMEAAGQTSKGTVGNAGCRLFSLPEGVDFAQQWMMNKDL